MNFYIFLFTFIPTIRPLYCGIVFITFFLTYALSPNLLLYSIHITILEKLNIKIRFFFSVKLFLTNELTYLFYINFTSRAATLLYIVKHLPFPGFFFRNSKQIKTSRFLISSFIKSVHKQYPLA